MRIERVGNRLSYHIPLLSEATLDQVIHHMQSIAQVGPWTQLEIHAQDGQTFTIRLDEVFHDIEQGASLRSAIHSHLYMGSSGKL